MSTLESRRHALGLTLPVGKATVANYLGTKRSGDLLFVRTREPAAREVGSDTR